MPPGNYGWRKAALVRLDVVLVNLLGKESAKGILRAELARRDISNQQLTDMLIASGVDITRAAVDNRISRGAFSADFFLDCLRGYRQSGCRIIRGTRTERKRAERLNLFWESASQAARRERGGCVDVA